MKMRRRIYSFILIMLMITVMVVYADEDSDGSERRSTTDSKATSVIHSGSDSEESDWDDDDEDIDDGDEDIDDEEEDMDQESDQLEEAAEKLEDQMDDLEDLRDQIEDQLEEALLKDDTVLAEKLEADLEKVQADMTSMRNQYKAAIQARKDLIKSKYTSEEIAKIQNAESHILKEDPNITVLGFDSVFSNTADFKFDTPPVIKDGRTLVPIRAVTEAFGGDVNYDSATKTVTITKDDIGISFIINSNAATVNGSKVALDASAEVTNNRTYIPLRFILETLDLDVEWDNETRTIEIDDPTVINTSAAPVLN